MELTKYIACICEGDTEQAIMELLLDGGNRNADYLQRKQIQRIQKCCQCPTRRIRIG